MATVYLQWPGGYNEAAVQVWYGTAIYASSTELELSDGYNTGIYYGTGLTYSTSAVTGGTVTGYAQSYSGTPVLDVTGISVPATTVQSYLNANNLQGLFSLILGGNDTIYGSAGNDVINAYAGSNYVNGEAGINTEVFGGNYSQYSFSLSGATLDVTGLGASDYLVSIQKLQFADQTITSAVGSIYTSQAAISLFQSDITTKFIQISDSASNVDVALNQLESLASSGAIYSIGLTDSGTPTISITSSQQTADAKVLKLIDTPYTLSVACFAPGTHIATAMGELPVETLRPGQTIRLADGRQAEVTWLGYRRVNCRRHGRPWDICPVRVAAHAFGKGQPARDLRLSPDHAVYVEEILIPIRYLINGSTITQEWVDEITYWHVELQSHSVLLANGLPCESYLDTGNRAAFSNGDPALMLYPDFGSGSSDAERIWAERACAPLVRSGDALVKVKRWLLSQAHALGFEANTSSDLHIIADKQRTDPLFNDCSLFRFILPSSTKSIQICSNSGIPAELDPTSSDTRRLGVMLSSVALRHTQTKLAISLDSAALQDGFHALETKDARQWRWTNGCATLELPDDFRNVSGVLLDIYVDYNQPSWLHKEQAEKPLSYVGHMR